MTDKKTTLNELASTNNLKVELSASDKEQKIGVIVCSYKYNTMDNYRVYTYDPIYNKFVDKICNYFDANYDGGDEYHSENISDYYIIVKSELDAVIRTISGISNYAVTVNDLNGLFASIDPKSDNVDMFNYKELLTTFDDDSESRLTMIGLNEYKLSKYRCSIKRSKSRKNQT